jgi:hypothetical protein
MINATYTPETELNRPRVRLPDRRPAGLFPGWGPKV